MYFSDIFNRNSITVNPKIIYAFKFENYYIKI